MREIITSYQRRKRDIAYYRQCIRELEDITVTLARMINKNGLKIPLLGSGINGDDFLTPYNNADFMMRLLNEK
jgi:hypothetical protein